MNSAMSLRASRHPPRPIDPLKFDKGFLQSFVCRTCYLLHAPTHAHISYKIVNENIITAAQQLLHKLKEMFIRSRTGDYNFELDRIHLVGHSLGSHIMAFASQKFTELQRHDMKNWVIERITALDPAQPCFRDFTDPILRLTIDDAPFIDVIHTNARQILHLGLGLPEQLGFMFSKNAIARRIKSKPIELRANVIQLFGISMDTTSTSLEVAAKMIDAYSMKLKKILTLPPILKFQTACQKKIQMRTLMKLSYDLCQNIVQCSLDFCARREVKKETLKKTLVQKFKSYTSIRQSELAHVAQRSTSISAQWTDSIWQKKGLRRGQRHPQQQRQQQPLNQRQARSPALEAIGLFCNYCYSPRPPRAAPPLHEQLTLMLASEVLSSFAFACNAEMQLEATVDQVLDAARQAVTSVVDTAQGVVNGAIDTAKNTVIGEINVVQDVAKLAIQTGRGAVEIGGNYVKITCFFQLICYLNIKDIFKIGRTNITLKKLKLLPLPPPSPLLLLLPLVLLLLSRLRKNSTTITGLIQSRRRLATDALLITPKTCHCLCVETFQRCISYFSLFACKSSFIYMSTL
ncbi:unnamed protein product [Trichogramma brassicae]|uniref:phospholipase A1 n=1 Tax=Trichogramma brassicae TaxID=86971 RepID=A0A6H5IHY7_9HYME|nr:unnamed protein product [Trichogramma brassicae]